MSRRLSIYLILAVLCYIPHSARAQETLRLNGDGESRASTGNQRNAEIGGSDRCSNIPGTKAIAIRHGHLQ